MSTLPKLRKVGPADTQAPEIRRLTSLLDVSQALSGTLNLKSALHNVLEILTRRHSVVRSIVTLLHEGGELQVEASDGLERPGSAVRYRLGEGVTGKVVETGKWVQKSPTEYCTTADTEGAVEKCNVEGIDAAGVWTSKNAEGQVATVERVES